MREQKVRINDLARELGVKSKALLDTLTEIGVTEKKTHSSSISDTEAAKLRQRWGSRENGRPATNSSAASVESKPKIDLSHISRPADVLKATTQKQPPVSPRIGSGHSSPTRSPVLPVPGQPIYRRPIASAAAGINAARTRRLQGSSRRLVLPQLGQRPIYRVNETKTKKTSSPVLSEPKVTYKNPIEEAEQALKALRMQDQNDGSGGDSNS